MRGATHLSERAYAVALRLYPPAFRTEFGQEMRTVFAEALAEATGAGASGIAMLWLRELRDLPLSLLRAHGQAHRGKSGQQNLSPPGPVPFARWGAVGFGVGFALVEVMPRLLAADSRCGCLPPWLRVALYLSAGALSGACLGLAGRSWRHILSFALTGALAFGLAVRATEGIARLSAFHGGMSVSLLFLQAMLTGALAGGLAGAGRKCWRRAARSALSGALMFGLGRLGGWTLALPLWGIAQAVASYQAPPANAWLMAMPLLLMAFAAAVGGVAGGAHLGRQVADLTP